VEPIYLDYNASTPIAAEVSEAMRPFLSEHYGNPSSGHWAGRPAREAVEAARAEVAALIGARPSEIVFTSGGSEANNYALKGIFFRNTKPRPHIVTLCIEHPAILQPCRFLERLGARISCVRVDRMAQVDPDDIRRAISPDTILLTVMHANNEVGTIQPIAEIARIAREHQIPFHSDAAQSVGKVPTRVDELGVDLMTIAGHKLYAPKGVGALYVRDGIELEPLVHGAGHESGRRAGTENVLLNVGLGAACRLARLDPCGARLAERTAYFWSALQAACGDRVVRNGHATDRLPNTLNVSFPGRIGSELLTRLDGVAASTGSACHSGSHTMSPVLQAMGLDSHAGLGAIRFSLGRGTTREQLDEVVRRLRHALQD
jgi:cysteine desulfurase